MSIQLDEIVRLYLAGKSTGDLAHNTGMPKSRIRNLLLDAGVLRTRSEAHRLACAQDKYGKPLRGKKRVFSDTWKDNIRAGMLRHAEQHAKCVTFKKNGYVEYTTGEHKGRSVHDVEMEKKIGRKLESNECVHHINGNRSDNRIENLDLMTIAEHARLHRKNEPTRARDQKGKFACQ